MGVDHDTVRRVATRAGLALTEEQVERARTRLEQVLTQARALPPAPAAPTAPPPPRQGR